MSDRPSVAVASQVDGRETTNYPFPFAEKVKGRLKRPLADLFGLTGFGANLTTLQPGASSSIKHQHTVQDELIYVVSGELVLLRDYDEFELSAGMVAGFVAGGPAHCLTNRSASPATYLEIGDRRPGDSAKYPDEDLRAVLTETGWRYEHRDGTPYA